MIPSLLCKQNKRKSQIPPLSKVSTLFRFFSTSRMYVCGYMFPLCRFFVTSTLVHIFFLSTIERYVVVYFISCTFFVVEILIPWMRWTFPRICVVLYKCLDSEEQSKSRRLYFTNIYLDADYYKAFIWNVEFPRLCIHANGLLSRGQVRQLRRRLLQPALEILYI